MPTAEEMLGKMVFVEEEVAKGRVGSTNLALLTTRGSTRSLNRKNADIFLASDPAHPGCRTEWACMLRGATAISPAAMLTGVGPAIGYHAALKVRLEMYISPGFQAAYEKVYRLIKDIAGKSWKFMSTEASYIGAKKTAFAKRMQM